MRVCTSGTIVQRLQDNGTNCIVFSSSGAMTCNDVCASSGAAMCNGAFSGADQCQLENSEEVGCETFSDKLHCLCQGREPIDCSFLEPLGSGEELCTNVAQIRAENTCTTKVHLNLTGTCTDFCMQRGVRCLSAWAAANCSDNLEGPEQIQCDTVGVDSALCVCPVPALDETCNYLIPWSREAMLGCNVQPLKQSMEAGNCVAAVSEESCDDFCWARNAVCVKAMGSELCGSFAGQKQVHCNSTGLDERYCSCRGPKPTATRESDETQSQLASSHCDFLQPLWTGEEECKTGVVVGMLQDRGTQCVAYASLGGTRSCADFCQERWSTCTAALQSPAAPCEVAEASSFSCNDAVTTAHCVCAVPGPGRSLCQSSRSCHELCSFSMAGGYTSCYRRCTRRFGQIQQTMQKHCAHGNACQSSEPQNEEFGLAAVAPEQPPFLQRQRARFPQLWGRRAVCALMRAAAAVLQEDLQCTSKASDGSSAVKMPPVPSPVKVKGWKSAIHASSFSIPERSNTNQESQRHLPGCVRAQGCRGIGPHVALRSQQCESAVGL